ncbi:unnamed protein product [Brachionus calyciflorus]|uniref:Uncharacterized protein n=1 Tax=Brachionus calyciflorus TaxID=104777 RepID=A0A814NDN1_9BILA|nr:unnamed protein product [Brachionus calyciflorus]
MAQQATGSFVREVIVRGLPNLYNIRDIFVRRVSSFIEEFNSENGRQLSTLGECRFPRTTETRMHAFISMGDLFDNDWLINALDGARFEEHTLEAQEYSRVEATVEIEDDREVIVQELALVRAPTWSVDWKLLKEWTTIKDIGYFNELFLLWYRFDCCP